MFFFGLNPKKLVLVRVLQQGEDTDKLLGHLSLNSKGGIDKEQEKVSCHKAIYFLGFHLNHHTKLSWIFGFKHLRLVQEDFVERERNYSSNPIF